MPLDEEIVADLRSAILRHVRTTEGKHTLTYGQLVAAVGRNLMARGIGPHLTAIGERCEKAGQPRLDYLVVNKRSKLPGRQIDPSRWREEVDRCSRYQWPIDSSG